MIRWQTPLAYMRRTALDDTKIAGKSINKGEKVVMWYVSGNRDEDMFENADELQIERKNARNDISFGFGIHRCLGLRLAELQLRITWQEILKRFATIEVVDEPKFTYSNFVHGYDMLPVREFRDSARDAPKNKFAAPGKHVWEIRIDNRRKPRVPLFCIYSRQKPGTNTARFGLGTAPGDFTDV